MLYVDPSEPGATEMTRKRSMVWGFFKTVDSASVRCLLCSDYQSKQVQGSTTNMLRHLRVKHPKEFAKKFRGRSTKSIRRKDHREVDMDSEQSYSVDVVLENEDSDNSIPLNESDVNAAISGILKAAQGDTAEDTTHAEASDTPPVRYSRPRSLIWRHYERLESLNAARCRICMKKLQCFESSSTSNLRRHLSTRHPEMFAGLQENKLNPPPSKDNSDTPTAAAKKTELKQFSGSFEGEKRVLRRERELIEALRRTQKEEAKALEHQRDLVEKLRAADAREAAAEREKIETLRKAQQEEAKELSIQREELQKEKAELQKKWEELQQEREEFLLFSRGQESSTMTSGL